MTAPWHRFAVAAVMAGVAASACSSNESSRDAGPSVIATTGIWADVVANVACDGSVTVEPLLAEGADPHAFEPSLADRARLDDAMLVVANGLDLEESLIDTLGSVESDGTPVIEVSDSIEALAAGSDDDPHFWADPTLVRDAIGDLGDALVTHAGADRAAIADCVAAYEAELDVADRELEAVFAAIPPERRLLVTNHDSMQYLADRYDFELLGTVIPSASSLAETSPATIEALADLIDETGVPAIFAETAQSSRDIDALAAQVGDVDVVTLHSGRLGPAGSGADTYIDMLLADADLIVAGLGPS